jgi:hypothetical protein
MERTDIYLQIIMAQPWLLLPIVAAVVIFFMISKENRLFVSLMLVTPWLSMGRAQELSLIAAGAKLTSGLAFLLVAYASITHPFPKRRLPIIVYLYPVMAFIWIFLILGVEERNVGVVLRIQWFFITIAGVSLARTIVTYKDFKRIINGFTAGCMLALLIPISALVLFPGESFLRGIGRFQPYGSNSNQVGMLFALASPLLGYAMLTWPKKYRPLIIFYLSLTLGMALLTASRQTAIAILITSFPFIFVLSKRPIVTVIGLSVAAVGLGWILSIGGEISPMERLGTLETGRPQLWYRYITEVFTESPLYGLLGSSGESYFRSNIIGQHPHSAWMNMMYHGGFMLFIPQAILVIYSTYSAIRVWLNRKLLPGDPLLFSITVLLLLAMYVQGSFNQVVYWPTYSWSFLHVAFACIFIAIWTSVRNDGTYWALPSGEENEEYYEEEPQVEEFKDYRETN